MTTQLETYARHTKTAKLLIRATLEEEIESLERTPLRDESTPYAIKAIEDMLGKLEQTSSMDEIDELFGEANEQLENIKPVNAELRGRMAGLRFVCVALLDAVKG